MTVATVGAGQQQRSRVTVTAQWVLLLASTPTGLVCRCRVCGDIVGTANISSRVPALPPYLYCAVREGPTIMNSAGAPDQGTWRYPTITGLFSPDYGRSQFITFSPLISTS
jgi:hypothetical protein